MTDASTTEAPIMLRVDITRDELKQIKRIALDENKTSQALLGEWVRERIERQATYAVATKIAERIADEEKKT